MLKTGPVFIGPVLAFEVTIELVEKTNQDEGKVNREELKKPFYVLESEGPSLGS